MLTSFMKELKNFKDSELEIITNNLHSLIKVKKEEVGYPIITGYNYFPDHSIEKGIIFLFSYLHRDVTHLIEIEEDLKNHPVLGSFFKNLQKNNIDYTRLKKAIYHVLDKNWRIDKSEETEYFNFNTGELLDQNKWKNNKIERFDQIPDFRDIDIGAREKNAYEIFFDLQNELIADNIVDLFIKKAVGEKLNEYGELDIFADDPINRESWSEADITPCIILGHDIMKIYHGEHMQKFSPIRKIAIIRGNNEISFYINKKYEALFKTEEYIILRAIFKKEFKDIPAFGLNRFVREYIDRI